VARGKARVRNRGFWDWVTVWPKGSNAKFHLCEGKLEPGNTGISLYRESVEKTAAALKRKGVKFATPVTKKQWGTFAMIADPDGNAIWLSGGGPWARALAVGLHAYGAVFVSFSFLNHQPTPDVVPSCP
jgi:hypothetical protein